MNKDINNLTISGIIIDGEKKARLLGYPTANIDVRLNNQEGYCGVYATSACVDAKTYIGALVILPTKIEVHLIDVKEINLYGKHIEVTHLQHISDIVPYESDNQMKEKIEEDIEKIKYVYRNYFSPRED